MNHGMVHTKDPLLLIGLMVGMSEPSVDMGM